jgi:NADH-quinone oxidoreductase subunit M
MNFWLHPLTLTVLLPLVGFVIILFLDENRKNTIRWVALGTALLDFALSLWVLALYNPQAGMQLEVKQAWLQVGTIIINFHLGIDGLGLLMLLLTTFLTPLAILSAWSAVKERVKGFMAFFMLLEVGMSGVFVSLDLVLFYIFWEFTLIPMYFLIGLWGGERRVYAAIKFFIYTMAGSVLMLLAILYIGFQAGTFSLPALIANRSAFAPAQMVLFAAFAIAFAIKVPMWPLHSWLPDAHVEAPTAGSVILAGVLLKMGAYGLIRFNLPLFPDAAHQAAPVMAVLAVIGILYGAAVALAQTDVKKLVAYSSVSHMGFVVLGIFSFSQQGLAGAILQMVNHGLSTGALFLMVGMLYERRHTRQLAEFGGLWKVTPVLGTLALIITLSSMGLPGLNGFVGEFTILTGAFGSAAYGSPWMAGVAALGVILAAVYLLFMFEKVFLGPVNKTENQSLLDLNRREVITLLPLLVLIFWIGIYPKPFFELMSPAVTQTLAIVQSMALALH